MEPDKLKKVIEAVLLASTEPLSLDRLLALFAEDRDAPSRQDLRATLTSLAADCDQRGIELKEVASGFRFQVRQDYGHWVSRLSEERPVRYSRALLETLALVAYRQPITRGEIEDVRGVSVSSSIIKTLLEREWVRVVGHREVPGKPALYGTTRQFLDYFGLRGLDDLPPLAELRDLDSIARTLDLEADAGAMAIEGLAAQDAGAEVQRAPESTDLPPPEAINGPREAAGMSQPRASEPAGEGSEERFADTVLAVTEEAGS